MESSDVTFRKSSYSGGANGSCVEVGNSSHVLIRDTKQAHCDDRTTLAVNPAAWSRFINTIK